MNGLTRITLLLFTFLLPWQAIYSQAIFPEPNWNRALALEIVKSVRTDDALKELYQSARAGDSGQVLQSLVAIERNGNWPVPAREYTIWVFTQGLADMEFNIVGPQVLDHLTKYQSQTLVAHDDRSDMGVPLFNIPAAAKGVQNAWARRQAAVRAEVWFQYDPPVWINSYLQAPATQRGGFTDALDFAADETLLKLGRFALERLDKQPALTAVAGKSALMLGNLELLQDTLIRGSGPELHHILKAVAENLDAQSNKQLLFQIIQQASDRQVSLAMAQLAPGLLEDAEVRDWMFNMLENRNLGASAALILGSSANPKIVDRLNTLAGGKDGLASKRASLAISSGLQSRETGR